MKQDPELRKKAEVAYKMSVCMTVDIHNSLRRYKQKLYRPGMEGEMREALIQEMVLRYRKALEAAVEVRVSGQGVLAPIFTEDRFFEVMTDPEAIPQIGGSIVKEMMNGSSDGASS